MGEQVSHLCVCDDQNEKRKKLTKLGTDKIHYNIIKMNETHIKQVRKLLTKKYLIGNNPIYCHLKNDRFLTNIDDKLWNKYLDYQLKKYIELNASFVAIYNEEILGVILCDDYFGNIIKLRRLSKIIKHPKTDSWLKQDSNNNISDETSKNSIKRRSALRKRMSQIDSNDIIGINSSLVSNSRSNSIVKTIRQRSSTTKSKKEFMNNNDKIYELFDKNEKTFLIESYGKGQRQSWELIIDIMNDLVGEYRNDMIQHKNTYFHSHLFAVKKGHETNAVELRLKKTAINFGKKHGFKYFVMETDNETSFNINKKLHFVPKCTLNYNDWVYPKNSNIKPKKSNNNSDKKLYFMELTYGFP